MAQRTKIEWTEITWNPVTGCDPISPGCANCYAKRMAERFRGTKNHAYTQGFDLRMHPERLKQPARWRKPRLVFANSMGDLFHKGVSDKYILQVFETMAQADAHTFQVLTKRADRLETWARKYMPTWPENVWIGVTVENQDCVSRMEHLITVPAKVRFVSFEPLLSEVVVPDHLMKQIQWAIVGGETGPRARRMHESWAISLRDQCKRNGVPFFFKHMGIFNAAGERVGKKRAGKLLDGQEWLEYPNR